MGVGGEGCWPLVNVSRNTAYYAAARRIRSSAAVSLLTPHLPDQPSSRHEAKHRAEMALQRTAVVAGTVAGAAAVVLVAKIIIRQHRFKVSCGCLLTCTCKEKMKRSAMGVASVAAEPTSGTSAPTSKEAPAEACCSAAPEPSAADVVRVEAVARKPPHSPDAGSRTC